MEEDQRTMFEYARPSLFGTESSIVRPTVATNNFEIKPSIIQMVQQYVQFDGSQDEDPNAHIANFLEICDTFKINGATDDAIRLRLFPFSLRGRAKQWLNTLPRGSITTWNQMAEKFLMKYFPPAKTAKLRNDISSYVQMELETLYDTWERFKELLRRCPHHGLPTWLQIQMFYNGLNLATKQMIDAAAGGTLNNKTPEAAQELIENMAMNGYQWQNVRTKANRVAGVFDTGHVSALEAQVEALKERVNELTASQPFGQVDYMGNVPYPQNNLCTSAYNPGWGNTSSFAWNNQSQQPSPAFQQPPPQEKKSNLEELLTKYIQISEARSQNVEASIHKLENQVEQIAKLLSERPQGNPPSITEVNPREHVNAISLRSIKEQRVEEEQSEENKQDEEKKVEEKKVSKQPQPLREYRPKIPYPMKIIQDHLGEHFGKSLEHVNRLYANSSFVEILSEKPEYAKVFKEQLAAKRKLEEISDVTLNEECSVLLQKKLPQKRNDPGSFTIPCLIGSLFVDRALVDLGASINLMPYSLFKKLGLGEPKSTSMNIQLADRSIRHPRGIIENVLIKVDKFFLPVDFVILDMDEDMRVPLILGRPFLATARAMVDVSEGKLVLRVGDEEVTFKMSKSISYSLEQDNKGFLIDDTNRELLNCVQERVSHEATMQFGLKQEDKERVDDPRRIEQVTHLKGHRPKLRRKEFETTDVREEKRFKPPDPAVEIFVGGHKHNAADPKKIDHGVSYLRGRQPKFRKKNFEGAGVTWATKMNGSHLSDKKPP